MGTIRELTSHRVNGLNEALRVFVLDEPGAGNACHDYAVLVPMSEMSRKINHPELVKWDGDRCDCYDIGNHQMLMINSNSVCAIAQPNGDLAYYFIQRITFQNGPVKETGYNGNSHEALLAILIDRLECFQRGSYSGRDNQMALDHLDTARLWLHKRTMDRVARGVEGTHQK